MNRNHAIPLILGIVLLIGACGIYVTSVGAFTTADQPTPVDQLVNKSFFATSTATTWYATTTSATSTEITAYNDTNGRLDSGKLDIRGAEQVTWYFSRGGKIGPNTGATRFEVEVSPDGTTWYDFNRLIGTDGSATATSTVTISAATSTTVVHMNLDYGGYMFARCIVVEITDGDHACAATVTY